MTLREWAALIAVTALAAWYIAGRRRRRRTRGGWSPRPLPLRRRWW